MSRRAAARLAWGLWVVDLAVVLALVWREQTSAGVWSAVAGSVFILAFATTGALVASRRPTSPIGWLLSLAALSFAVGGTAVVVSEGAGDVASPVETAAAWVGTWVWILGVGTAATFLLLLFPDGHLPSPRWRPVAWLAGGALTLTVVSLALAPGPLEDTPVTNPIGVPAGSLLDALAGTGLALLGLAVVASCLSLAARFRSAGREQRLQLKWVAYSLPVVLTWLVASVVVESTASGDVAVEIANTLVSVGLTVVPVAIAVAMLRHRLYDIDVVVNRTLVYGSLSALLAGVYLGSVLLLRLVLDPLTQDSQLAVAASTLAVATLVRPARRRIQAGVDRRFYRSRYDAARTLESFGARLRQEVDLEAVCADLRRVAGETVQPTHVSVWLRS